MLCNISLPLRRRRAGRVGNKGFHLAFSRGRYAWTRHQVNSGSLLWESSRASQLTQARPTLV